LSLSGDNRAKKLVVAWSFRTLFLFAIVTETTVGHPTMFCRELYRLCLFACLLGTHFAPQSAIVCVVANLFARFFLST
jgi:hypothetical protein